MRTFDTIEQLRQALPTTPHGSSSDTAWSHQPPFVSNKLNPPLSPHRLQSDISATAGSADLADGWARSGGQVENGVVMLGMRRSRPASARRYRRRAMALHPGPRGRRLPAERRRRSDSSSRQRMWAWRRRLSNRLCRLPGQERAISASPRPWPLRVHDYSYGGGAAARTAFQCSCS